MGTAAARREIFWNAQVLARFGKEMGTFLFRRSLVVATRLHIFKNGCAEVHYNGALNAPPRRCAFAFQKISLRTAAPPAALDPKSQQARQAVPDGTEKSVILDAGGLIHLGDSVRICQ